LLKQKATGIKYIMDNQLLKKLPLEAKGQSVINIAIRAQI
jgi:hypothetical protein